jgi:hypothetical protein
MSDMPYRLQLRSTSGLYAPSMPREYGAGVKHAPAEAVAKRRDQGAPTFALLTAEARERSGGLPIREPHGAERERRQRMGRTLTSTPDTRQSAQEPNATKPRQFGVCFVSY